MKTLVTSLSLFFLLAISFSVNAAIYKTNTLINVKLEYVNFYEAVVDVEFYLADDLDVVYFYVDAIDVTRSRYSHFLRHGFNKIKVLVQRERKKNSSVTTQKLRLYATTTQRVSFWHQELDFKINWPGPEYINEIVGDAKVEHHDYSSVNTVNIERQVQDADRIYKDVLIAGIPIYKARLSGALVKPDDDAAIAVKIGQDVHPSAAKKIVSVLLQNNHNVVDISINDADKKLYFDNDIVISNAKKNVLSPSVLADIKNNIISDSDFYDLLGIEQPDSEDYVRRQYEIAYGLIDSGIKSNLQQAKTILDEIISKDPEFVDAYIELARYIMKTTAAPTSFDMAEKKLLIAKDINPDYANTRVLLGYVYTFQKRYAEAEQEYIKAEKLGTDNLWLYANWGLNYEKQSKTDKAIDKYIEVMSVPRGFDRNDRVMLWIRDHLFVLLEGKGRYEEANRFYTRFATDFPSQNCILLSQAENELFNLGNYESAIKLNLLAGKKGCTKESISLAAAYYLKWFDQANGENRVINGVYRQAQAMSPEDARLFYYLAMSDYTAPVISALIRNTQSLDVEDHEGFNAVLLAVYVENHDAVDRLLSQGADVNSVSTKMKVSPLGLAVVKQDVEMVRLLLKKGADSAAELPNGKDLYTWSKENGVMEISQLLGGKSAI